MSRRKEPAIPNELFDQLLAGGDTIVAFDQGGLLDSLKKALTERCERGDGSPPVRRGRRRQHAQWLRPEDRDDHTGKMAIDVPRDRQSSFDP